MSPNQRFPFHAQSARLPTTEPNRHLSPHCNPQYISQKEQSRGFPKQSHSFLASFAIEVSSSNNAAPLAEGLASDPLSANTTQGRLHCPQRSFALSKFTPPDRFNPASYPAASTKAYAFAGAPRNTRAGLHGRGVEFHMPLQIAPKP